MTLRYVELAAEREQQRASDPDWRSAQRYFPSRVPGDRRPRSWQPKHKIIRCEEVTQP